MLENGRNQVGAGTLQCQEPAVEVLSALQVRLLSMQLMRVSLGQVQDKPQPQGRQGKVQ